MRRRSPFPGRQPPSTSEPSYPVQAKLGSAESSAAARLLAIDHLVDQIILILSDYQSDFKPFSHTRYGTFSRVEDVRFSPRALDRVLGSARRLFGEDGITSPHSGIFPLPRSLGALACANRLWRDAIWKRQWVRVVVDTVGLTALEELGSPRVELIRYVSGHTSTLHLVAGRCPLCPA